MLQAKRHGAGLTQVQLAESMGVRSQSIARWEKGSRPQPRFYLTIASFLGLDGEEAVRALVRGELVPPLDDEGSSRHRSQPLATSAPVRPEPLEGPQLAALREAFIARSQHGQLSPEEIQLFWFFSGYNRNEY